MYHYAIAGFLTFITSSILGAVVYFKNPKRNINRLFTLFSISVALYGFGFYRQAVALTEIQELIAIRILLCGTIFIPVFFLHVVYAILEKRISNKILYPIYIIAILLESINFLTNWLARDPIPKFGFKYLFQAGILYPVLMLTFGLYAGIALWQLFHSYRSADGLKRNQLKYIFFSTLIGFGGGSAGFALGYNIELYPLNPFGAYCVSLYSMIFAYAIIRHQLLEIEVIIKKTLVFASLFAVVFGIFVGITLLTQELIAGGRLLGLALSSIIIILTVRPLGNFLVRITDKYLFQKKYDYKHLIRQFMDELKTMVLNAQDIAQSTLDFLNSSIRPVNSAIFMYNKFTNKYDAIASIDFKDRNFKISDDINLVNELCESGKIINISGDKFFSVYEKGEFIKLGIELFIPLIIHKDLLGIVCLGKKKSDEQYTEDDIDALSDLSGALAIAINNAQLFDERADAEKRAMIGTLATGINHEIGNPLNIINIKLQSFQLLAKRGLLEGKTKEEIIDEVTAMTNACLEGTQRIADITKKVSEFAKPDKKLMLDKFSVEEAINETISILEHELALERVKFEKDIQCESPFVLADRGQLNQILFNLIKNAAQAINTANIKDGKITIIVNKHGNDKISIKVNDNGPGIPTKDLDKVFIPFYTTKEPGRGTGLGLALVNRLIERNNAEIKVQSEEGKGTTFTLIFKGKCYG